MLQTTEGLNGAKFARENRSHLNALGEGDGVLAAPTGRELQSLRVYVRRVLGFTRELQRVVGGTVIAGLLEEGERALEEHWS